MRRASLWSSVPSSSSVYPTTWSTSRVDRVGGAEVDESSDTGHGLGDFSVGLAKTVLRERNWWPDVVLRVNWDTGLGERTDNDVALDGGFQELAGSVSLVKRQDPLVFVAGSFYEAAFEEDDIDPGDTLGFSLGTFLAASPNTSLRVVLNQSFIDEFEVDGLREVRLAVDELVLVPEAGRFRT